MVLLGPDDPGDVGVPSVGASGAVFGLAGLMLATLKWGHIPLQGEVRTLMYKEIVKFSCVEGSFDVAIGTRTRSDPSPG